MQLSYALLIFAIACPIGWSAQVYDISGATVLPQVNSKTHGVAVILPFELKIFNHVFSASTKYWISNNGYISVDSEYKNFNVETFPLDDASVDPLLLCPYRAHVSYRPIEGYDKEAEVSYKISVDSSTSQQIQEILRLSVVGEDNFTPKNTFVVTWKAVSFEDANPKARPYPRNTFQLIITTDGKSTYAILNYENIVWEGGDFYGGDPNTGIGANNPPPQAGFNLGGGQGFVNLAYGDSILDLEKGGASDYEGQYIYRISGHTAEPVGCVRFHKNVHLLQLHPPSGPMFGGNPVEVSGPCFSPGQTIYCKFGSQKVIAQYISTSKAVCYAPQFFENGPITFNVLTNDVEDAATETHYFVSSLASHHAELVNITNWRSLSPELPLELKWNPLDFSTYKGRFSIKLYTYMENQTDFGWTDEVTIATNISNTGKFSFDHSAISCTQNCHNKVIGSFVVEMIKSPDMNNPGRLWSRINPLGWYVNKKFTNEMGDKHWPDRKCYEWFKKDSSNGSMAWLDELEDCPCTLDQAIADIGRFVPDPGCNIYTSGGCFYHQGSKHCVRSIWPSKPTGAGNQCCYGDDGNLKYAGDSIYGSTPDKGHSQGAAPYNKPGLIPDLSHWLEDVVTYEYCCRWNTYSSTCGIYMDQRPTKDCNSYETVKPAVAFGDPHFATFDGEELSLKQVGDYTLLSADSTVGGTTIHVRLCEPEVGIGSTIISGIAAREDNSATVEILLNHKQARTLQKTVVKVDGMEVRFEDVIAFKQEFKGVTIFSWNLMPLTDQSNFTVTFKSGLGMKVSANEHHMNVIITTPVKFKGHMHQAQLGTWNDDITDDAGVTVRLFGDESLFSTAADDSIIPLNPIKVHSSFDQVNADRICRGIKQCVHDYQVSGKATLAQEARDAVEWYRMLQEYSKPVISCGMPLKYGEREGNVYLEGNMVTLLGCRHGYKLVGLPGTNHTCGNDGLWWPPVNNTSCEYEGFPELLPLKAVPTLQFPHNEDKLALPLALGLSLAIVALFVVGGVAYGCAKKRHDKYLHEVPTTETDTDNGAYTMSQGSMRMTDRAFHISVLSSQMPEPGKSYRVAVDPTAEQEAEMSHHNSTSSLRYASSKSSVDNNISSARGNNGW